MLLRQIWLVVQGENGNSQNSSKCDPFSIFDTVKSFLSSVPLIRTIQSLNELYGCTLRC